LLLTFDHPIRGNMAPLTAVEKQWTWVNNNKNHHHPLSWMFY